MKTKTKILLTLAFLTPALSRGDEADSARNFAAVVDAIADHDEAIAQALTQVASAAGEVESINQQIVSKRQEAERLQKEAQDAFNQASLLNNLAANQGAGAGGGGGGGGGSGGGGSKGLQLTPPELPEMPEAAAFELPSAPPGVDVGDLASSLSFNSRGATSSPVDTTFPPFTNFNLPANPAAKSPKLVSPGSVAAGNLPQLSGNSTPGTPIGPSQNAGAMPGGVGGGGMPGGGGMMGGGFGGGMMGGGSMGGPDGGGDVMASVGSEPYSPEGGLRVQTQQMGESGGDGGGAAASEASGGGPDESTVKAQIARGVAGTRSSKEKNLNPEGKGLMAYVGFIESACRKENKTMEVCKSPKPSAEKAKLAALPKEEALTSAAAPSPKRNIASPPTPESYGPVRAGLLGLVSGK